MLPYCSPVFFYPQFYFYMMSPVQPLPPSNLTTEVNNSSELPLNEIQKAETVIFQLEEQIILNEQDLLEEGYELKKRPWSEEEDKLLLKLCKNENARFDEISALIQGRNAKMCYSRFRRLTYRTKETWSNAENIKLISLVEEHGEDSWKHIAEHFQNRNYKQLKDHYTNYLRPTLNKTQWTVEEDMILIQVLNSSGKNWRLVESKLPGRSCNQIKNRYFGRIKRLNAKKLKKSEQAQLISHL